VTRDNKRNNNINDYYYYYILSCAMLMTPSYPKNRVPTPPKTSCTSHIRQTILPTALFFFSMAQQPIVGQGLLIIKGSLSHSNTPHSVGLLWKRDGPVSANSIWHHITQQIDIHAPGGLRTRSPNKLAAKDPHLRPRGHWDLQAV
jgi:hypothetical protein